MATPALASVATLESLMGDVGDVARAQSLLWFSSELIRTECGETWLDDDGELETVPGIVQMVCCKVVQRSLANPLGVSAERVVQYEVDYADSSTDLYLTKQERRLVRKAAGTTMLGAVELVAPYQKEDVEDVYMTASTGEEIPMGPWPAAGT